LPRSSPAPRSRSPADRRLGQSAEENEAKLARMLEGRTAGEPVSCISALAATRIEVIEHVGIVYDAGSTIYVARPTNPNRSAATTSS
jgi:hypothetical protein